MKIAHVITRLIIGGAQENTVLSCAGLRARGHEVALIAGPQTGPEGSLWEEGRASADRAIVLESLRREVSPRHDREAAARLTELFRRERFDVVHTHSSKAGILGRWAAHRAGVPIVVHTIHGMSFNRTQSAPVRWAYRVLERRAARWTDAIVSVADAMTAQARAAGIHPRGNRYVTIRSGMRTSAFHASAVTRHAVRSAWGVPRDALVIGTVARLFPNKGYEAVIEAMPAIVARCPNAWFVWIGDGSHRDAYVSVVERLGLRGRLHLTGLVPPSEIPRLLNGLDVLVHASLWEGLPRVLVQAGLCRVPAVSFDNDGAPEVIENGVTGRLAPLGDVAKLAEAVADLANNPSMRKAMGEVAEMRLRTAFDHERMVSELDALYRQLAAGSRVPKTG